MLLIISGPKKAEIESQLKYKHINLELLGSESDAKQNLVYDPGGQCLVCALRRKLVYLVTWH